MAMTWVWAGMVILSLAFGLATGSLDAVAAAAMDGAASAVELSLSMAGVLCLWSGVMEVMKVCGLSDALARRDMLRRKRQMLSNLAHSAQERDYRLTHSEVKMRLTLDLGAIQKEIDALSKQFRELDTRIQGVNWTAELLD